MSVRDEILERLERLPDVPTYADAFDQLRPLYNRDVAPIIAQYGEPPRPQGQWGAISRERPRARSKSL
jgi:hypothetical protein